MADTTTTTYSLTKPEVGASADTWGTKLNTNFDTIDDLLDGTTAISPNLSGFKVGGTTITSTGAELNILDGVTATASEINKLDGLTSTTAELNKLDGYTGGVTELNYLDSLHATGVTSTEFDYLDGVTSNIQTQLNAKGTMTSFQLEDGDGTEVTISNGKEVKFVEGNGIDINWTDTSTGSDGDPYDLTFGLKSNSVSASELNVSGNGSSGQALTSDGDGSFSWADAGGGWEYLENNPVSIGSGSSQYFTYTGIPSGKSQILFLFHQFNGSNTNNYGYRRFRIIDGTGTSAKSSGYRTEIAGYNAGNNHTNDSMVRFYHNPWTGGNVKISGHVICRCQNINKTSGNYIWICEGQFASYRDLNDYYDKVGYIWSVFQTSNHIGGIQMIGHDSYDRLNVGTLQVGVI